MCPLINPQWYEWDGQASWTVDCRTTALEHSILAKPNYTTQFNEVLYYTLYPFMWRTILFCTVLHYTTSYLHLFCTIFFCTLLYSTVPYYTALCYATVYFYTALCYTTLYYISTLNLNLKNCYNIIHCTIPYYAILYYSAL